MNKIGIRLTYFLLGFVCGVTALLGVLVAITIIFG